ncbi:MAG: PLP-dependent aspartate aminotransferase family protein [Pseudomonadota bacterium]
MDFSDQRFGFATRAIHAGQEPDEATGAIMTPVYMSSTFVQSSPGVHKGYEYSRTSNPTRAAYEKCVASLEGAKHGFAFASGSAASATIMHLLRSGDHILCCDDMYGGTYRQFEHVFRPQGLDFSYADLSNANNFQLRPETKMVWLESPTNPLLKLTDITAIAERCRSAGVLCVVDNTFMSPYFQNPIKLGADIVVHSATKYLNGHSDLVGGVAVTDSDEIAEKLAFFSNAVGGIQANLDAFLCMRSLKTLAVRMREHEANAHAIAQWLETHPRVTRVLYPGLESHPQHELAKAQTSGFGGMVTFYIEGGLDDARRFLERTRLFSLAESLGGVESLVEHPAIMTHASIPAEQRAALGISDTLIRLSVGIESLDDLLADLEQALAA